MMDEVWKNSSFMLYDIFKWLKYVINNTARQLLSFMHEFLIQFVYIDSNSGKRGFFIEKYEISVANCTSFEYLFHCKNTVHLMV